MNPPQPIFVDTWGWLAYGHRRDAHPTAVKELVAACRSQRTPVHISDYVLDELITLLFRRESYDEAVRFLDGLLADSARGVLQIQRLTTERFQAAAETFPGQAGHLLYRFDHDGHHARTANHRRGDGRQPFSARRHGISTMAGMRDENLAAGLNRWWTLIGADGKCGRVGCRFLIGFGGSDGEKPAASRRSGTGCWCQRRCGNLLQSRKAGVTRL